MSSSDRPRVRTGGIFTIARLLRESPILVVGITIFGLLVLVAIFEPVINNALLHGNRSTELGLYDVHMPSSREHFFGTDERGRDVLALQFTGLRNSLLVGMLAGAMSLGISVILATVAGYVGGRTETVITAITNSWLIIPSWPVIAILVLYVAKVSLLDLALVLAAFGWPSATRVMTAQIASLKSRPYVDLAKLNGFRSASIMFREVLPNFLPYIVLSFSYAVAYNIMAETGLRVIGLGPQTVVSLGELINFSLYAGTLAQGYYLVALCPIVMLVLIFASLNFINLGMEEVYNPRLKKITGL
ncbi:MAG: ABC transporter permease [Spirochaetia bacterium]|jgi:peptide/nickel transport system permease protein